VNPKPVQDEKAGAAVPFSHNAAGTQAAWVLIFAVFLLTVYTSPGRADEKDLRKSYSEKFMRQEKARLEFEKGKTFFEDKAYNLARKQMETAIQLDREHLDARYYLGLVESRCGEYKLALEHFTRIYKTGFRHRDLLLDMASCHLALGSCDKAERWLKRYLKHKPKSKKALQIGLKIKDCMKKMEKPGG
ncbi:MAG: tetratricopeptide repeat protein, partial [Gemmatimonadota bacterium]|nr:tetratricopeptide repeat protein [Gemmatimonadota bacterium]